MSTGAPIFNHRTIGRILQGRVLMDCLRVWGLPAMGGALEGVAAARVIAEQM